MRGTPKVLLWMDFPRNLCTASIGRHQPLTPEQRRSVPNADHTALFTRDEVLAALQQLVPAEEAAAIADELYAPDREPDVFFVGELLTALSCRVRAITAPPEEGLSG